MMMYAEVKAATTWMESTEMKDYFYDNDGQQTRAQWSFLKNINTSNPKQSFFPRLKPRIAEEAQDKTRKTTSSEAVTIEDADEESGEKNNLDSQPEKNKKTEKELGAKRKTGTRSRSPRIEIAADDQDDEEEGGEEQNEWLSAGGRNGRRGGRGGGGRGGNRGERSGRAGKGTSSSQASMREYISTPKTRLASGAAGGSLWSK